ncbi:MAG: hypothetical protein M1825_000777 [Sarcosagium campestre]|nr:MAG: hypothetical protein M1825_000777 [Sarcosagium campestre]
MAFFPANSTYPGMLAELYSAAFTAPAFNWICSPAVTELETIVLDWMASLLHLPACYLSSSEGGGVIQGSASEAIVTTMVAARDRYLTQTTQHLNAADRERAIAEKRSKIVVLGSSMSHSSTLKAALIVGARYKSVNVSIENDFSMKGADLQRAINECLEEGLEPFYLTATLGTTGTCAVDRFDEIATVLKNQPFIWTHVDAAYAGAALVCDEYHYLTEHFESFDSFDMNMHKWLLTNFDASCLYVKQRKHLTNALSVTPSYLRNGYSESGLVTDYRDWQIPLGRRFRALKIWFVVRTYGAEGFKSYIREHIRLGEKFAAWIAARPDLFRILSKPAFALTVFSITPQPVSRGSVGVKGSGDSIVGNGVSQGDTLQGLDETNELTKDVYETINSRGKIYLTSTVLDDIYAIRVVSANTKTEEIYLQRAFDILVSMTEEILGKKRSIAEAILEQISDIKTS